MLLKNRITIVTVNKCIVPHDQRREQLARFQDIFFKLLELDRKSTRLNSSHIL